MNHELSIGRIRNGSSAPAHLINIGSLTTLCGQKYPLEKMGLIAVGFGTVVCKNCLTKVAQA